MNCVLDCCFKIGKIVDVLVGFGNPEKHIPMLADGIVFSFEAINDFLSFFRKFTSSFNSFVHGNVDWSNIKFPVFEKLGWKSEQKALMSGELANSKDLFMNVAISLSF